MAFILNLSPHSICLVPSEASVSVSDPIQGYDPFRRRRRGDGSNGHSQSGGVLGAVAVQRSPLQVSGQFGLWVRLFSELSGLLRSSLIPRAHASIDLDSDTPPPPKKRLFLLRSGRKIKGSSVTKKKMTAPASKLNLLVMQSNKKRRKKKEAEASGLSPTPSKGANCLPFATKGLNKVLKAATKHFKKKIPRDPRPM